MKNNKFKEETETMRVKFFAQVQEEYDAFREKIMRGTQTELYELSLKITFYKEVYQYLMDDMLSDEEYTEFTGEKIIQKLWDVFVVSELPRKTRDYLRQLLNLHRQNKSKGKL
jgi:hypothetical protein